MNAAAKLANGPTCDGCSGSPPLTAEGFCERCERISALCDPIAYLAIDLRDVWESYGDALAYHAVDGNGPDLRALREQVEVTEQEIRRRADTLLAQLGEEA